jgi:spermidine synthase
VQSTSPYFAKRSFWCIDATLREAGFFTYPYHTLVPSFGEWGYVLAKTQSDYQPPAHYALPMRFLDADSTRLMFSFPPDMRPLKVEANHLNNQALVHYFQQDWGDVIR